MISASPSAVAANTVTADAVIAAFNACFMHTEHTVLVGGADEPFYQPATVDAPAQVQFRADYVRSALHEVAHWCVAGQARRRLPDYGYWYTPDDRNEQQQTAFFAVEARPQALESIFCEALGIGFRPSVDNLSLDIDPSVLQRFEQRLQIARADYASRGLPSRAARFTTALAQVGKASNAIAEVTLAACNAPEGASG